MLHLKTQAEYQQLASEMDERLKALSFDDIVNARISNIEFGNAVNAALQTLIENDHCPTPQEYAKVVIYGALMAWRAGDESLKELASSN